MRLWKFSTLKKVEDFKVSQGATQGNVIKIVKLACKSWTRSLNEQAEFFGVALISSISPWRHCFFVQMCIYDYNLFKENY